MKKLISVFLSVSMLASLASCGNENAEQNTESVSEKIEEISEETVPETTTVTSTTVTTTTTTTTVTTTTTTEPPTEPPTECPHQWVDANCTQPKHCELCGATEGNPLGHQFIDATYDSPKTCSICGKTMGSPLPRPAVSVNIITPIPREFSTYTVRDEVRDTIYISEVRYDIEQNAFDDKYSLILYFSGEKTYDIDGSGQNRNGHVSVKISDADGYVVDNTTFYTPSLGVGDRFKDVECKIYDLKRGTYNIEFMSTN